MRGGRFIVVESGRGADCKSLLDFTTPAERHVHLRWSWYPKLTSQISDSKSHKAFGHPVGLIALEDD